MEKKMDHGKGKKVAAVEEIKTLNRVLRVDQEKELVAAVAVAKIDN